MTTGVVVALCCAVIVIGIIYLALDMMKVENKYIVLFFVFMAAVAVLTNPKLEDHSQAMIRAAMQRTGDDYNNAGGLLALSLAKNMMTNMIDVDSYLVFSFTKIHSRIVGIGAFGNVWIFEN
jgi:hypothetical protein